MRNLFSRFLVIAVFKIWNNRTKRLASSPRQDTSATMEKKGEIKKRGRTYCVAGAPNDVMVIMLRYVEQFPHTKYVPSAYWLFPKRLSTQNFILLRLRSGKTKTRLVI